MKSVTQYARAKGITRQATLKRIKTGKVKAKKVGNQYVIGMTKHDTRVGCAMNIIERVIEPLHYPKRGVSGEKYYELEDAIIKVLKEYF